jgi:hypothetical protein
MKGWIVTTAAMIVMGWVSFSVYAQTPCSDGGKPPCNVKGQSFDNVRKHLGDPNYSLTGLHNSGYPTPTPTPSPRVK